MNRWKMKQAEAYQGADPANGQSIFLLQHLTHQAFFMGFEFYVNENVLVPRQDTETLVECALDILKEIKEPVILDMCTGSGCILLSLLAMKQEALGTAVDISAPALEVAKRNAASLEVEKRVKFVESDLFSASFFTETTGKDRLAYDILISNPPYIRSAEIASLMEEVKGHDPYLALDGHGRRSVFLQRDRVQGKEFPEKRWLDAVRNRL